jgi:hypothetical protein
MPQTSMVSVKGICAKSECDTVVVINVRGGDGGNASKWGRSELIHWSRKEFVKK